MPDASLGLTAEEVKRRLEKVGSNTISEVTPPSTASFMSLSLS